MRITRLELQAIGPFRDKVEIDFEKLGTSGLYLIDGETGAGKSTLIDAIVYGLYGTLASSDSDESRLRSKFASNSTKSFVIVDFITAKGQYRIERSPAYTRKAERGGGETRQEPKAALFKLGSDGSVEPIENRINTLKNLIPDEVVGLTKAQFVQTVVLPQGEFANFLRADTSEREALMQKLFGTELYNKIAELLKRDASLFKADLDRILDQAKDALIAEKNAAEFDEQQANDWAENLKRAEFEGFLKDLELRLTEQSPLREMAQSEVQRVKAEIESVTAEIAQRTKEAEAQKRVATLTENAKVKTPDVETTWAKIQAADAALQKFEISTSELKEFEPLGDGLQKLIQAGAVAAAAIEKQKRVDVWPARMLELTEKVAFLEAEIKDKRSELELIPAQLAELTTLAAQKVELATKKADLASEKLNLESAINKSAELVQAKSDLDDLENRLKVATEKVTAALADLNSAHQSRIRNIAGELASELKPGERCVVCGSTDHPAPAIKDANAVSLEDIEDLQSEFDAQQQQQLTANNLVAAANQKVEILQAEVSAVGDIESKLAVVSAAISETNAEFEKSVQAESSIKALREKQDLLNLGISDYQQQLTTNETTLKAEEKQIAELNTELDSLVGGFVSVNQKAEVASRLVALLQSYQASLQDLENLRNQLADAEKDLAAFDQHPEFADVSAAKDRSVKLLEIKREADQAFADLKVKEEALIRLQTKISNLSSEYRSSAKSNADLLLLSQVFNKDDANQQNLSIYVLAKLFENVLAGANRYLEGLLNAQFRLEIDQEYGTKAGARGLGVKVFDAFASDYRPAKTLSGGESFCVSLSLALGLADYVRQGAGGIEIGTLFIDEGFGTLSDGPLTDVMNMLTSLQRNGRTVGLISHVDEMKSQITERIEVTKATKDAPATLQVSWQN